MAGIESFTRFTGVNKIAELERLKESMIIRSTAPTATDNTPLVSEEEKGKPKKQINPAFTTNFLPEFYTQVAEIQRVLHAFDATIESIQEKHKEISTSVGNKNLLKEINELVKQGRQQTKTIKGFLDALPKQFPLAADKTGTIKNTAENRIKNTLSGALSKQFGELVKRFTEAQLQHSSFLTNQSRRQLQIASPSSTPEQIDEWIDSGKAEEILKQKLVEDPKHAEAQLALVEVQQQSEELKQLERSVIELSELFLDMQRLVFAQGALIDQIAANVATAEGWVDEGSKELVVALKHARNYRKKVVILIIIGLVIVAVVLIPIIFSLSGIL